MICSGWIETRIRQVKHSNISRYSLTVSWKLINSPPYKYLMYLLTYELKNRSLHASMHYMQLTPQICNTISRYKRNLAYDQSKKCNKIS